MKKTTYDGKDWVFKLLSANTALKTAISGKIYKDKRPSGSTKEDIVINALPITNDFLQDMSLNVNCYVPFRSETINGIEQDIPNNAREQVIANLVHPLLDDVFKSQFNLTIENQTTIAELTENANYINFRINLKAYN